MNETDKATLAAIAALLVADRISVAKALEGAYLLGELTGKIAMARIPLTLSSFFPIFQ